MHYCLDVVGELSRDSVPNRACETGFCRFLDLGLVHNTMRPSLLSRVYPLWLQSCIVYRQWGVRSRVGWNNKWGDRVNHRVLKGVVMIPRYLRAPPPKGHGTDAKFSLSSQRTR